MRRQRGFTIAEMIVALIVSALLVTLTYGALRIGTRSWDSVQTRTEELDTLRVGWRTVHTALTEAVLRYAPEGNQGQAMFIGRPDKLVFTANMPSHLGLGGTYLVELSLEHTPKGKSFVLRRTLWAEYLQPELENRIQSAELAMPVKSLAFRYFGRQEDADQATWSTQWMNSETLPSLIRLDVNLSNGKHWPLLIAHPRIAPLATEDQGA